MLGFTNRCNFYPCSTGDIYVHCGVKLRTPQRIEIRASPFTSTGTNEAMMGRHVQGPILPSTISVVTPTGAFPMHSHPLTSIHFDVITDLSFLLLFVYPETLFEFPGNSLLHPPPVTFFDKDQDMKDDASITVLSHQNLNILNMRKLSFHRAIL